MHVVLFSLDPVGIRNLHVKVNWGGSPLHPSWICRMPNDPDHDEAAPWGPLRLFNSNRYVCPCTRIATPFYSKGTLRTAKLCQHYLKACDGCQDFFLTRRKWDGVCTGCHSAIFCSTKCQRDSWAQHKPHCKSVKAVSPADKPLVDLLTDHLDALDDTTYDTLLDMVTNAHDTITDLRRLNTYLLTRMQHLKKINS